MESEKADDADTNVKCCRSMVKVKGRGRETGRKGQGDLLDDSAADQPTDQRPQQFS